MPECSPNQGHQHKYCRYPGSKANCWHVFGILCRRTDMPPVNMQLPPAIGQHQGFMCQNIYQPWNTTTVFSQPKQRQGAKAQI